MKNYLIEIESIADKNRVYLDEAGSNLAMSPTHAWSPKNKRAYDKKPARRGGNISLVGAIKNSGMQTLYPYDGAVNSEKFIHFIENSLKAQLDCDDVLIMDNCSVHRSNVVKKRLEELNIRVLFMPPYSPELNPIEEAWSVIKRKLRHIKARSIAEYVQALPDLKNSISAEKSKGFFKHSASFQSLR